jgi:hypothetical protein
VQHRLVLKATSEKKRELWKRGDDGEGEREPARERERRERSVGGTHWALPLEWLAIYKHARRIDGSDVFRLTADSRLHPWWVGVHQTGSRSFFFFFLAKN